MYAENSIVNLKLGEYAQKCWQSALDKCLISLRCEIRDADGRPLPGIPPVVKNMSVKLPAGSRTLLIGPNGAGKTTLLKILGGKHIVLKSAVQVLGEPPFHNTELTSCGDLSYLGGNWDRDIAFAGYSIPLQATPFLAISHTVKYCWQWNSIFGATRLEPQFSTLCYSSGLQERFSGGHASRPTCLACSKDQFSRGRGSK